MRKDEGATQRLGRFVASCVDRDFSAECIDKAAACLLDALGLALIAREEGTVRAVAGLVPRRDAGAGCARLWADGEWAAASEAVEANGIAVHAHFHDDSEYSSWSHPGSLIVPVAVSLGEAEGKDAGAVLRGIISGYAAVNWLGADEEVARALIGRGVRTSPTLGTIAAAAAAATVLGLDAARSTSAVGMATSITGGLLEPVRTGSDEWRLQNGHAARGGMRAAQLAARGVIGAQTALEGPKGLLAAYAAMERQPARWSEDPDPDSIVTRVVAKPYATLGDNMAPAIAAKLLFDGVIDSDAVEAVRVTLWRPYAEYPGTSFRGPFTNTAQALASTAFATAAMLACGELEYDVNRDRREDPAILRLAERVTIEPDDVGGPEDSVVEVTLADGSRKSRSSREAPKTLLYHDAETAERLLGERCVRAGLPGATGRRIAADVLAAARGERRESIAAILDSMFTS